MSKFFPHYSNARYDNRIMRLRMKHGAAGYGVYFMLLERLTEEKRYMSVKDYNAIAFDLRVDTSLVKSVVEDFGLFAFAKNGECFYSDSLNIRMGEYEELQVKEEKCVNEDLSRRRSEAGKIGVERRWGKHKTSHSKIIANDSKIIANDSKTIANDSKTIANRRNLSETSHSKIIANDSKIIANYRNLDVLQKTKEEEKTKETEKSKKEKELPPAPPIEKEIKEKEGKKIEKEEGSHSLNARERKIFRPPTPEEVRAYIQKMNYNFDAQNFCDFYESKGWFVGKNKMKDWRAACRTWQYRNKDPVRPMTYDEQKEYDRQKREKDAKELVNHYLYGDATEGTLW